MAIRVAPRATISDSFKTKMVEAMDICLKKMRRERDGKYHSVNLDNSIARITHFNMDTELTKLRSLPYEEFGVIERTTAIGNVSVVRSYLVGQTHEIRIGAGSSKWDLGKYLVAVPVNAFDTNSLDGFHFVPLNAMTTTERFPHHYATGTDKHPLDMNPRTCWGSFPSVISTLVHDGDIAELFRLLQVYLTRYDPGSVLVDIRRVSHAQGVHA